MHVLFVDHPAGPLAALAEDVRDGFGWTTDLAQELTMLVNSLEHHRWDAVIAIERQELDGVSALTLSRLKQPAASRCLVIPEGTIVSAATLANVAHRVMDRAPNPTSLRAALTVMAAGGLRLPTELADVVGAVAGLPAVARILSDLRTALADPNVSPHDISKIVRNSPALATKVLHLANAGLLGRAGAIHDIEQAAALLGTETLRQVVMASVAFIAAADLGVDPELVEAAQRHGVGAAAAAARMGTLPPVASTGALLLDIGMPLMALAWPEKHAEVRAFAMKHGLSLSREEQRILGASHSEAGALLVRRWGLPTAIAEMIAGHHFVPKGDKPDPRDMGFVVHHAAQHGPPEGRDASAGPVIVDVPDWVRAWPADATIH